MSNRELSPIFSAVVAPQNFVVATETSSFTNRPLAASAETRRVIPFTEWNTLGNAAIQEIEEDQTRQIAEEAFRIAMAFSPESHTASPEDLLSHAAEYIEEKFIKAEVAQISMFQTLLSDLSAPLATQSADNINRMITLGSKHIARATKAKELLLSFSNKFYR